MLQWIKSAALLSFVLLAGCAARLENNQAQPPFEEHAIILSGDLDALFDFRFTFREGTSILFGADAKGKLSFCLTINDDETCHTTGRVPQPIYIVEFMPHCQDETLALSIRNIGHPEPPFTIFYVDGAVTLNHSEAVDWVSANPNCHFQFD